MKKIDELYQRDDWKTEKHVPVIELPDEMKAGEPIKVKVTVGKEISHPNTTEHFIQRIDVYFMPEDGKFPYRIGGFTFDAHGASTEGPDTSTIYTDPCVEVGFKTEKSGTLMATSYCNIHGIWTNEEEIELS